MDRTPQSVRIWAKRVPTAAEVPTPVTQINPEHPLSSRAHAQNASPSPAASAWMVSAEIECNRRYGAIPTWAPEESRWFREIAYQAYRGDLSRDTFANRLRERYPGYRETTECLADELPKTRSAP